MLGCIHSNNSKILGYEGDKKRIPEIDVLLKENHKDGIYPINDDQWVDVGQWEEYKKAVGKIT